MKARRCPWLSGLVVALFGTVWMVGQVLGGLASMVGGLLVTDGEPPAWSSPIR